MQNTPSPCQLSDSLLNICATSPDPMVRHAPRALAIFFTLDRSLPPEHKWEFSSLQSFENRAKACRTPADVTRLYWHDKTQDISAYSFNTMLRASELLTPAIRGINIGELLAPAVLARALLELSTAYLHNANAIQDLSAEVAFEPDTITIATAFEERLERMIWGNRQNEKPEHLKQTNILTLIQKLTKHPNASDLLPHYELLCEIAHPNALGNSRFWSHVAEVTSDGKEIRIISRTADAGQIRTNILWSLAWSSAAMTNAFAMIAKASSLLSNKLEALP